MVLTTSIFATQDVLPSINFKKTVVPFEPQQKKEIRDRRHSTTNRGASSHKRRLLRGKSSKPLGSKSSYCRLEVKTRYWVRDVQLLFTDSDGDIIGSIGVMMLRRAIERTDACHEVCAHTFDARLLNAEGGSRG